jgi:hypothetical protein
MKKLLHYALLMLVMFSLTGCGEPGLPTLTPVTGVLILDGKPLPLAEVRFQPLASGLPTDAGATAVTDAEGRFTMTTAGRPGAIAGEHTVTIAEGPPPEEVRGDGPEAQKAASDYEKSLVNRPIPSEYGTVATSKCRIKVTSSQQDYEIRISR